MDCIDKITTGIDEPKGQTFIASEVIDSVTRFYVGEDDQAICSW
jgi:hypothetical protein